jgi:hypothetical protein
MLRRALLVAILGTLAVLVAVSPARANGDFYLVQGPGEGSGQCTPYPNVAGGFTCPSLRAAVAAATADPGFDEVILPAGDYQLTQGSLDITDQLVIAGEDARHTRILGDGSHRVMTVEPGANAVIYGLTISGGTVTGDVGGGIRNFGTLEMEFVRVTASRSNAGGAGVASDGLLLIINSLIDGNTASAGSGGGIFVNDTGSLLLENSTVFNNQASTAGGIDVQSTQGATLVHVTVANNRSGGNPGGARFASPWLSYGSLFAANQGDTPTNCEAPGLNSQSTGNVEDRSGCGFAPAGTNVANTGLDTALTDQGGHTPVLTIPAASPAKGFDGSCHTDIDQRDAPRTANGPCDAGAFEQGATAPPLESQFAFPTPTASPTPPPTPTAGPTATPTASPTPTPVPGKSVVAVPVKGTVRIKKPGTNQFIDLDTTQGIPPGSTVDTKHGTIQLTSVQKVGGKLQTAIFFDGIFKLTQTKQTTDLTLDERLAACPKKDRRARAAAASKKPKTRKLWGSGHGSFRTKGQYSAATVRGTKWLVQDSCAGTLTRVAQGVVSVRDNVRHKTITLRAGKHYLARPRR